MKIICAVDGSEFSLWGIDSLRALAAHPPERLTLFHVIDGRVLKSAKRGASPALKRAQTAMDAAGRQLLSRMTHRAATALSQAATAPHTVIRTALAHGPVAEMIVKRANREQAALTIVGSRGRSDLSGFLLGSVSRKAAALASHPVLVVKQPLSEFNRVVLAVDGSKSSRKAAEFLCRGFLPESAHVTVLSVAEPPVTELAAAVLSRSQIEELGRPSLEQAHRLVQNVRELFVKEGYAVATEVQADHVTETILKFVTANAPDLLVVGSRGLTGTERLQLGSVSEALLKYAPCSVLIVRGTHV